MNKPWKAEQDVSSELATQLILAQFPELGPGLHLKSLGAGWDNNAYLINNAVVFRFPRRAIAVPLLETEMGALPQLAPRLSLPISCPTYFGKASEAFQWPFAGYALLAGETACTRRATNIQRQAWAKPLAAFMKDLHAIPLKSARQWGLQEDGFDKLNLQRLSNDITEHLETIHKLGFAELAQKGKTLLTYLQQHLKNQPLAPNNCLLHGDLYIRHFLVDEHNVPCGIIDWGDIMIGNNAIDLSVVFTALPESCHSDFFAHYGAIDALTKHRALLRALLSALTIWVYGHDIQDSNLAWEGQWAVGNLVKMSRVS